MVNIRSRSGEEVFQITLDSYQYIRFISNTFPGWNSQDLSLCWCLLRRALYSRHKKYSLKGTLELYKPTLIQLGNRYSVDSILEVMEYCGLDSLSTPNHFEELIETELG